MDSHVLLVAAAWALLAQTLASVVKQDHLPAWVNSLLNAAVLVGSGALVTWQTAPAFTVHAFSVALFGSFAAAVAAHQIVLGPTGVSAALQSLTSFVPAATFVQNPLGPGVGPHTGMVTGAAAVPPFAAAAPPPARPSLSADAIAAAIAPGLASLFNAAPPQTAAAPVTATVPPVAAPAPPAA